MKEWIIGSLFLLAVLAVGYVWGLPIAGSLFRQARAALWTRRYRRQITHLLAQPGVRVLKP